MPEKLSTPQKSRRTLQSTSLKKGRIGKRPVKTPRLDPKQRKENLRTKHIGF